MNTQEKQITKIGNLNIGYSCPPVIIAEIGINHSGSLSTAKYLVDLAAENGADIIKSQFHIPHEEMSNEAKKVIPPNANISIFEIMEECALTIDEEYELKEHIESTGKQYLSTPFSALAAKYLDEMQVKAFKIGSGECSNRAVLESVAKFKKPMIISTGLNTIENIKKSCQIVEKFIDNNFLLMHTTNLYPTPNHLVRLGGLNELQKMVGISRVGLSDHTISNLACLGGVALGAVILERHFTDTKERKGPDIVNSMTSKELKELKQESYQMFQMRGGSKISEISEEDAVRDFAFATVVATKDIAENEILTKTNCWPKRPGIGEIKASEHNLILGKCAKNFIPEGKHILKSDIK